MNRIALSVVAAATAALGTACGNNCPTGTTLVSWTGFDGPTAAVNQSCATAGVASVNLWLDNQLVGNWACASYSAAIPGVPTGGNLLDVEGLAADGTTILFRDSLAYTQPGCGNVALQAFPGSGTAALNYAFQTGSGSYCQNGSTFIWFTLFDDIANPNLPDPASIGAASSPRQWPCGPTDPVVTLPNGQFTLAPMDAVSESPPGTFTAVAGACNARAANPMTFTVASGSQAVLQPLLVDSACLN